MVAWKSALVAALLLSASCTSIFDSYYSDSLEFLESQADLSQVVGGKTIVSVHLKVLPGISGAYQQDTLAVVVDTNDGEQHTVFYGMDMKKIQSYSQSVLTAEAGGTRPDLYPIIQDGVGLYTGQIAYSFTGHSLHLGVTPSTSGTDLIATSLTNGTSMSPFITTYYDDNSVVPTRFPVVYNNNGGGLDTYYTVGADSVGSISAGGVGINYPTSTPLSVTSAFNSLLDAVCWKTTYYVVFSSGSALCLMKATTVNPDDMVGGTFAQANPNGINGLDLSQGHAWATAKAAVVSSHSDNGNLLTAFSWSGKNLGSIRVNSGNDNGSGSSSAAYAFHPDGQYWFVYDPANGRISKYKAWW